MTKQERREKITELVNEINDIENCDMGAPTYGHGDELNDENLNGASLIQLENEILRRKNVLSKANLQIKELEKQIEDLL